MIIGNGNVAVDVARILLSDPEDLACTNIADHALKTLRTSKVREVVLLGRRGPEQAAFTRPEFLALQHLPGVRVVVDEHPEVRAAIAGAEPGSKAAVVSPSSADAQRTGNSSLRVGAVGVPHWCTPRRTPRRSRSGGLSRSRESSRSKTSPRSRRVMKKVFPGESPVQLLVMCPATDTINTGTVQPTTQSRRSYRVTRPACSGLDSVYRRAMQAPRPRTTARAVLVLFLLTGLLGMHALPAAAMPAAAMPAAASTTEAMVMAASNPARSPDEATGHGNHSDSGHAAMHMCLAVLLAAGVAVLLVLLGAATPVLPPMVHRLRTTHISLGRAPPWVSPDLAELSVLRV